MERLQKKNDYKYITLKRIKKPEILFVKSKHFHDTGFFIFKMKQGFQMTCGCHVWMFIFMFNFNEP